MRYVFRSSHCYNMYQLFDCYYFFIIASIFIHQSTIHVISKRNVISNKECTGSDEMDCSNWYKSSCFYLQGKKLHTISVDIVNINSLYFVYIDYLSSDSWYTHTHNLFNPTIVDSVLLKYLLSCSSTTPSLHSR